MGEIAPCLRAAFVVLHIGCANVYVRASSLAPVNYTADSRTSTQHQWIYSLAKHYPTGHYEKPDELLSRDHTKSRNHQFVCAFVRHFDNLQTVPYTFAHQVSPQWIILQIREHRPNTSEFTASRNTTLQVITKNRMSFYRAITRNLETISLCVHLCATLTIYRQFRSIPAKTRLPHF